MDTQLFNEVIGEVPPSTVDVEAAITRSRRAARIRRMANPVVVAGVAVVLLTGAVAYTMTRGDGGSGVGVGGQPTSTSSEAPAETSPGTTKKGSRGEPPEACSRPDLESGDEVETRLSGVAKAAVQAQRSDLQVVADPSAEYPVGVARGPLDFYQVTGEKPVDRPICHEDSHFMGRATTNGPEAESNILMLVEPNFSADAAGMTCRPPDATEICTRVTGPNGETIVKRTLPLLDGTTEYQIDMDRPDGTHVMVSVRGTPTASEPPLTLDQLIAIGTDPGMTLFP